MSNKKLIPWLKGTVLALFTGLFSLTAISEINIGTYEVQAAESQSGTIYYGFQEITNIGNMTKNNTYMFLTKRYSSDDAVCALPDGSARLELTATPASGGQAATAVTDDKGQAASQGNVRVVQSGKGFDTCTTGHIGYVSKANGTGWYYGCYAGGVSNVGPFYAYSYYTASFNESSITIEVTDAFEVPTSKRYYTDSNDLTGLEVKITVNGKVFNVPYFTVVSRDNSVDPETGDTSVVLNIGGVEKEAELRCRQLSPSGQPDYSSGEIRGLTANAEYDITVDGRTETVTADENGNLDLTPYQGKTISLVKKGNGNTVADSDPQTIEVKQSAAAPEKDNYQSSVNGAYTVILGITDSQEYSLDGGQSWISGTGDDVRVKTGESVLVREKATKDQPASEAAEIETVEKGKNLVIGRIENSGKNPCAGAELELRNGNTVIGTATTEEDGSFAFIDAPEGTYNLVVKNNGKTEIYLVTIKNGKTYLEKMTVSDRKTNSTVNIVNGAPAMVVGNIQAQFDTIVKEAEKGYTEADDKVVKAGGSVEINVKVETVKSGIGNVKYIKKAASKEGMNVGNFIDIIIKKIITDAQGQQSELGLTELPGLLTFYINIDPDIQGKASYVVYRYHQDYIDTITTSANEAGEYIEISEDRTRLIMHVKKFSTYAIGYSDEEKNVANKSVSIDSLTDKKADTPAITNPKPTKKTPKTGDDNTAFPFFILLPVGIGILMLGRKGLTS